METSPETNLIRVVLADDHNVVRAGIKTFLQQSGRVEVVAEATNGRQAVQLTVALAPDVVVLDIQMPEMNGIETTRVLRSSGQAVGILILTAYDERPYVTALLKAGANGYLLKTAQPSEIVQAVVDVYQGKQVIDTILAQRATDYPPAGGSQTLSERELEVLRQAAAGFTNKAIASQLNISSKTVQNHLSKIFTKMNCQSRTEMVTQAIRLGWLQPDPPPIWHSGVDA